MVRTLFYFLSLSFLLLYSCNKSAPAVEADLSGYELTQIPGSDSYKATKTEDNKKVQEGYVLNGKRNGQWLDFHPDDRISQIQHYINGVLNGPVIIFDTRGQIIAQTDYKNGIIDGIKAIYKFGRPQEEAPYVDGKINGVLKKYYTNNKIMEEVEYKDNVQHGYYRHYSEEGVLDLEYVYKDGEKVSGGIVAPKEPGAN